MTAFRVSVYLRLAGRLGEEITATVWLIHTSLSPPRI